MTCKICKEEPKFRTLSSLRKHQWKSHRELYAHVGKPLPAKREPLTAAQVLEELRKQQIFLGDVVSLIDAMVKRHES